MTPTRRPSFLKSQKEQKRKAKAEEKRAGRLARRLRSDEPATPEDADTAESSTAEEAPENDDPPAS